MHTGMMYILDYIYETEISVISNFRREKLAQVMFTKLYHWYVTNKLSVKRDKINFV